MNKVLDIISKLCCLILSLILFFVILFFMLLNVSTKVINKENIIQIFSNLDIEVINKSDFDNIYEEYELKETDKQIVYGVINSKEFKELLGKHFGNVTELILYDKQNDKITRKEVMSIISNKMDYVANENGINLTYDEKQTLINLLEGKINEIVETLSNEEEILNEMTEKEISSIRFFFGKGFQTILLIVIVILVVLIMIFRWSFYRFAIWTGISTAISGIFFAGCTNVLSSIFRNEIGDQISIQIIDILGKNIFSLMYDAGVFVIVLGIVQIMYYFILRNVNENTKV